MGPVFFNVDSDLLLLPDRFVRFACVQQKGGQVTLSLFDMLPMVFQTADVEQLVNLIEQ